MKIEDYGTWVMTAYVESYSGATFLGGRMIKTRKPYVSVMCKTWYRPEEFLEYKRNMYLGNSTTVFMNGRPIQDTYFQQVDRAHRNRQWEDLRKEMEALNDSSQKITGISH